MNTDVLCNRDPHQVAHYAAVGLNTLIHVSGCQLLTAGASHPHQLTFSYNSDPGIGRVEPYGWPSLRIATPGGNKVRNKEFGIGAGEVRNDLGFLKSQLTKLV